MTQPFLFIGHSRHPRLSHEHSTLVYIIKVTMTGKNSAQPRQQPPSKNAALAQQYGGLHTGSWVSLMPLSWIPYVQLAHLSPPAGVFLIYFLHLFGAALGGIVTRAPLVATLRASLTLLMGSFFLSNAAHAWNDIADEPFDRAVDDTRQRPIPRGANSRNSALLFAISQAAGAFATLWACFPDDAVWYATPNIILIIYYSWAKQHTHLAQFVLGVCLAWGVFIGSVALNHQPFAWRQIRLPAPNSTSAMLKLSTEFGEPFVDAGVVFLFLAYVLWTVIYDTIYAHQDVADDIKLGLKSTAVFIRGCIKLVLEMFLSAMLAPPPFLGGGGGGVERGDSHPQKRKIHPYIYPPNIQTPLPKQPSFSKVTPIPSMHLAYLEEHKEYRVESQVVLSSAYRFQWEFWYIFLLAQCHGYGGSESQSGFGRDCRHENEGRAQLENQSLPRYCVEEVRTRGGGSIKYRRALPEP